MAVPFFLGIIDILLVGNIDQYHLIDLSRKTERYIKRKVRSLVLGKDEFESFHAKMNYRPLALDLGSQPKGKNKFFETKRK